MITQVVHCPYCQGMDIVRHGTTPEGKQRYRCRACPDRGRTFLLEYAYAGQSPEVKRQRDISLFTPFSRLRPRHRIPHGRSHSIAYGAGAMATFVPPRFGASEGSSVRFVCSPPVSYPATPLGLLL